MHSSITYQKRNYEPKSPLKLNGLMTHGFIMEDDNLRYVVATDYNKRELKVVEIRVKSKLKYFNYLFSIPVDKDHQYYIATEKRIPNNNPLQSVIIVKTTEAARTSSSLTYGKRAIICSTTKISKETGERSGIYFAVYNTV